MSKQLHGIVSVKSHKRRTKLINDSKRTKPRPINKRWFACQNCSCESVNSTAQNSSDNPTKEKSN